MSLDLKAHIAALRKGQPVTPASALLFIGSFADKPYISRLKPCVGASTTHVSLDKVSTVAEVEMICKAKRINKVISTSIPLLSKLLNWQERKAPSLENYAGSYFYRNGIEYVFIHPLKQLVTVAYGSFLTRRMVSKLTDPDRWYTPTAMDWHITTDFEADYSLMQKADLIAVDIETLRKDAAIQCISYTGFYLSNSTSVSIVFPIDSMHNVVWMRKFNQLDAPKILQNGKYDISYLARYNAPIYNYLYDTAHFFHSWYSELPKSLGFLNSFFIRKASYWKDLIHTDDINEFYRYNALDTWGTGNCFLAMLQEAPQWALDNYIKEFPLVFPCHMAEMRGIKRDMVTMLDLKAEEEQKIAELSARLNTMLSVPNFNVASPIQMKQLLSVLGCSDLESADEKNLLKASNRHPLNAVIIDLIIQIRKARKLVSTYLTEGNEFKGRVLYSLNPHGTDSSRLASKEHHFWCGINIQNIPRGQTVKSTLVADPGFMICEVDLAQAESRDTAYIAGEEHLIHAVEESPDFHSYNASNFFGVPFDEIFKDGKIINKTLRQLAKPVNHGANYNMGANVLIHTMGELKVYEAKKLLNLPKPWSLKQVAEYLLAQFHKTYPGLKQTYYKGVVEEIVRTRMLKHHTADGWTRYCFGDPVNNKQALNSYIAHPPQALNAQTLNKAWLSIFRNIAMKNQNFKLLAQVHDSVLFQYREGHEYLIDEVKKAMEIPVTIKGYDGKVRTFTVPADPSKGGKSWAATKG